MGFEQSYHEELEQLKEAHREVGSKIPPRHLSQLAGLPAQWRLCGTGNKGSTKDAFELRWNSDEDKRYTALQLLKKSGDFVRQCLGAGVMTGPASGGLLVIDFDEPDDPGLDGLAEETFIEVFGRPSSELPVAPTNTSGRKGRRKVFLQVPEEWWEVLGNHSATAGRYSDGQKSALEVLWRNGSGSAKHAVVAGDHNKSTPAEPLEYHWIEGHHPAQCGVRHCPAWVIDGFRQLIYKKINPSSGESVYSGGFRNPGEPAPCDLLSPKEQRKLLNEMQKHWPYRGAPVNSPFAASYTTQFRPLVAGLLNVLGRNTAIEWLGGGYWDKRNDWADGGIGSFDRMLDSLSRSQVDSEAACGWGSIVRAATETGYQFPDWALPPREPDITDFLTDSAKKVVKLREALEKIDALGSPTERRAAMQELRKIVGCTADEMVQLITLMREEDDNTKRFTSGTLNELMNKAADIHPCIEKLLVSGAVTMVASEGGVGKSVLIYRLAEAVAYQEFFAGKLKVENPGPVLIVQKDESDANAKAKLLTMGLKDPDNRIHFRFQFHSGMYPELRRWVDETGAKLLVMDSFGSLFGGDGVSMGDADVGLHLYRLNQLASETDCAIVLTHHLRKMPKEKTQRTTITMSDLYGSSYIANGASDVWGVQRSHEEQDSDHPKFLLTILKARTGINQTGDTLELVGNHEDLSLSLDSYNGEQKGIEQSRSLQGKVLSVLKGRTEDTAMGINDLAAAVGSSRTGMNRVIRTLMTETNTELRRAQTAAKGGARPKYVYWVEGA